MTTRRDFRTEAKRLAAIERELEEELERYKTIYLKAAKENRDLNEQEQEAVIGRHLALEDLKRRRRMIREDMESAEARPAHRGFRPFLVRRVLDTSGIASSLRHMEDVRIDEVGRERLGSGCFVKVCASLDENYARAAYAGSWQRLGESGFTVYAQTPDILREIGELLLQGAARLAAESADGERIQ